MKTKLALMTALVSSIILAGSTFAADAGNGNGPAGPDVERPNVTGPERLGDGSGDLHDLMQEFREQRLDVLQARQQLREQIQDATAEERAQLIAQFREQYKERLQAERALRKEIRGRLMEIRRERRQLRQITTDTEG